jgi:ankyrin repeat protein
MQDMQDQRELFIRRKYVSRAFLGRLPLDPAQLSAALHEAIKNKDTLAMLRCIAHNADVNREAQDELGAGCTPMMQAVKVDYVPAVELLLQNRAEVGKRDNKGRTCLHHAALLDHGRCTQVLLTHGASADVRDDMGETALEVAAHAPRAQAFEAMVRSKGLRMGGNDTHTNTNTHRERKTHTHTHTHTHSLTHSLPHTLSHIMYIVYI